ncbi:hypothetical protein ACMYMJ_23830, partial [Salmonella enterica subsp. enterica serovar Enteritidis]|uniref:hypothetical protein n=1 Tax=Salmonella enterica TaxID=28901 RepID=UPI0039E86C69
DGQRLFLDLLQLLCLERLVAALDGQRALGLAHPVPGVDEQVVDAGQQDDDGHHGADDLQRVVVVGHQVGPVEGRDHGDRLMPSSSLPG